MIAKRQRKWFESLASSLYADSSGIFEYNGGSAHQDKDSDLTDGKHNVYRPKAAIRL